MSNETIRRKLFKVQWDKEHRAVVDEFLSEVLKAFRKNVDGRFPELEIDPEAHLFVSEANRSLRKIQVNEEACQLANAPFVVRPSGPEIKCMLRDPEFFAAVQEYCAKANKDNKKYLPGDP